MRCEDIRELMSEHIDGVLDEAGESRLSEHLAECEACRLDLEALRQAVSLVQDLDTVQPPADLLEKVHARIERDREQKPGIVWSFLSMTQVRVAIAACFVAVLCIYGVRQLTREPPRHRGLKSETDVMPTAAPVQDAAVVENADVELAPEPEADALIAEKAKHEKSARDKAGRKLGWGASKAPERVAGVSKDAARRYDRKIVPGKSAEADGGIWREGAAAKAKRRAPRPVVTAPPPAAPPAAAPPPAEVAAKEVVEQEESAAVKADDVVGTAEARLRRAKEPFREEKKTVGRGTKQPPALDAVASAPARAATATKGFAAYRKSGAAQSIHITVATAKRDAVLKAVRKAAEEPTAARRAGAASGVAKKPAAQPAKPAKYEGTAKDPGEPTVIDLRIPADAYAKLVEQLKKLGKVSVAAAPDGVAPKDVRARTNRVVSGVGGGGATRYVTIRVTIVAK